MLRIYKRLLPRWGAYLTDAGDIHLGRLADFLGELALIERAMFRERAAAAQRGDHKVLLPIPKHGTRNPKPYTRNPKPYTRNPKP